MFSNLFIFILLLLIWSWYALMGLVDFFFFSGTQYEFFLVLCYYLGAWWCCLLLIFCHFFNLLLQSYSMSYYLRFNFNLKGSNLLTSEWFCHFTLKICLHEKLEWWNWAISPFLEKQDSLCLFPLKKRVLMFKVELRSYYLSCKKSYFSRYF